MWPVRNDSSRQTQINNKCLTSLTSSFEQAIRALTFRFHAKTSGDISLSGAPTRAENDIGESNLDNLFHLMEHSLTVRFMRTF